MNIQLNLSVEETNAILQLLGQAPTSTGVYPIMMKVRQQADMSIQAARTQSTQVPQNSQSPQQMPLPQNFQAEQNAELGRQIMNMGVPS